MSAYSRAFKAWQRACQAEAEWVPGAEPFRSVMLRRDAATRHLHYVEDPWQPCICPLCDQRSNVSRET